MFTKSSRSFAIRRGPPVFLAAAMMLAWTWGSTNPVAAYTPDSLEVQALVRRGVNYLNTASYEEPGGKALIGLALYKAGEPKDHPQIKRAVDACRDFCAGRASGVNPSRPMYNEGICLIFLCEVDPQQYKPEIAFLLQTILDRQQSTGGWSYQIYQTGDTSQTQYCTLALWEAARSGFNVPAARVAAVMSWLIRTQDPSGGWGYQGRVAEEGQRGPQTLISHSLTAAGLSSLYVTADMFGYNLANASAAAKKLESERPPDLKLVGEEEEKVERPKARAAAPPVFLRAQADGVQWLDQRFHDEPVNWKLYYMYAYERYRSFREKLEGKEEVEPEWYNYGVDFLISAIQPEGYWSSKDTSASIDTSFALLFLTRSTKKSIGQIIFTEDVLQGTDALATAGELRIKGNTIVAASVSRSVDDLLGMLDGSSSDDLDDFAARINELTLDADQSKRAKQTAALRSLVSNTKYEARLVAVRKLGQIRDFDNVPALIYALGDPDLRVAIEARSGLRFISRKFAGFGMPDDATPEQRTEAIKKWKQWYLSVRPGAELFD